MSRIALFTTPEVSKVVVSVFGKVDGQHSFLKKLFMYIFDKCTFKRGELSTVAVLILGGVGGQRFRAFASFGQK